MQAETVRRQIAQGLTTIICAASIVVAGPAAPKAEAIDIPGWANPCNAPGGKYVCEISEKGSRWLYGNSGAKSVVDGVSKAVDFASDPLGYIEQKLRGGTKGMFEAFGEELTGKKSPDPADKPKKSKGH